MAGISTTRLRVSTTCADKSIPIPASEKSRVVQITHCSTVPFLLTPIANLAIRMLFIGHKWRRLKRGSLLSALRNYLRHYRLTQEEAFIHIGPWTETLTLHYGNGSRKDSNVLVFATDFTLTPKLRLTVHRYYEHRVFCTLAYSDTSRSVR